MRKLKEVLRLHSLGMSQHRIARSCSVSQSTVHDYVSAAQADGVKWPLPEDWGDPQIIRALFPQRAAPEVWRKHPEPDWGGIHKELQTHKNLTLQLIWQEKRESDPEGYGYSRFCELYGLWLKKLDLVLRQTHRADVCRLRRSHDSDPRSGDRRNPSGGSVRGSIGRQQLHLRRSHGGAGSAELDRFPYPGV